MHSYAREKATYYFLCLVSFTIMLTMTGYHIIARMYREYDWRIGIVTFIVFTIASGSLLNSWQFFSYYVLGRKCPKCGGMVEMDETEILGTVRTDDGTVPPIIDRISACEICGRDNHLVYTAPLYVGSTHSYDGFSKDADLFYRGDSRLQKRPKASLLKIFNLGTEKKMLETARRNFRGAYIPFLGADILGFTAMVRQLKIPAELAKQVFYGERTFADVLGEDLVTYKSWYAFARAMQERAAKHNKTSGFVIDWPERMSYIPEGYDNSWLLYGKYEWKKNGGKQGGEYVRQEYASRPDPRPDSKSGPKNRK